MFARKFSTLLGSVSKSLPSAIFAEFHYDPATMRILRKFAPRANPMGYNHFFEEMGSDLDIHKASSLALSNNAVSQQLMKQMGTLNLNPYKREDVVKFMVYKSVLSGKDIEEDDITHVQDCINRYESSKEFIEFLSRLQTLNINYKGIDIDGMLANANNEEVVVSLLKKRNKCMAKAYVTSPYPVFGRIGLAHNLGIQNEIVNAIGLEEALKQFQFFYIHSFEPYKDPENTEEGYRSGEIVSPLGIKIIDASRKRDEEVVELIEQTLLLKQQKLSQETKPRKAL